MPKETLSPSLASKPQVGKLYTRLLSAARKSRISTQRLQAAMAYRGTDMEEEIAAVIVKYAERACPSSPTRKKYINELMVLLREVVERHVTTEGIARAVIHDAGHRDSLTYWFDSLLEDVVIKILSPFPIAVDYSRSFKEMVEAGKYGEIAEEITPEHFPVSGEGQVSKDVELFQPEHPWPTELILEKIEARGCRPAKIEELLAFGEAHPEMQQRKGGIVALGSQWRCFGEFYHPWLWMLWHKRALRLVQNQGHWSYNTLFAMVKKEESQSTNPK